MLVQNYNIDYTRQVVRVLWEKLLVNSFIGLLFYLGIFWCVLYLLFCKGHFCENDLSDSFERTELYVQTCEPLKRYRIYPI